MCWPGSISDAISGLKLDANRHPSYPGGAPIESIESSAQVKVLAEYMLLTFKRLSEDQNTCLHVSIAGGTKTIGFYLNYAMSIYARKLDTLTHVFVTDGYEKSDFFFPTKTQQWFQTPNGVFDKSQGEVTLLDIPFLRLRELIPSSLLEQKMTFQQVIDVHKVLNSEVSLHIDRAAREIRCSGVSINLSEANFAFYCMLVDDLLDSREGYDVPTASEPCKLTALHYINKRISLYTDRSFDDLNIALTYCENTLHKIKQSEIDGLRTGMKKSFFSQRKSEINKAIRRFLPASIAEHYDIDSLYEVERKGSSKPANYYGINLDREKIEA